ncbi:acetate--CoA ligase family protein [Anabaena cylindrica UHCC 0172]|uniref:ATP-binding protein n=1 Tax=Anabaena cylindrica TaxID=1165 RepID=UPI002B1F47FE|nr:acetate--CoA ligase family protein [Anabaena cylindrica]MEA5551455.1 acetate--CoA ligase family protein [Anabaena cylindrica UHCC 0172]
MFQEQSTDRIRINARRTDVFDIFNFKYYIGSNPYLDTGALVFDFALTEHRDPLPIKEYAVIISDFYPHLASQKYQLYADLFAHVVSEVGKLDMGLHLNNWTIKPYPSYVRIGIQALHEQTIRGVVYLVWDWLESISQNKDFPFEERLIKLQNSFRESVYGGSTVYALLQAAYQQGIPAFYLWEEGLMQYGYGKKQIRGVATTFEIDSHLDSEFTTRKDDSKEFLQRLGFPVPNGDIVISEKAALAVAREIGYPVAIKPVVGHKRIGVTPDVQNAKELKSAYNKAILAIPKEESQRIIVEKSISGNNFRLLCVNRKFVAATELIPASVVGDGYSTIRELIKRENRHPKRRDTPTSPMSKILINEGMELYLNEQRLGLDSIVKSDRTIYLSKVANISSGGISINVTNTIHPDNIILAQDIAQNFRLTCLGIDIIAKNISKSWKSGNFTILKINAAPGILMHLNPVKGESIDVPFHILSTFFKSTQDAKIPIITFNKISLTELQATIDHLLLKYPDLIIGAVCNEGIFINRSEKILHQDYNYNVQTLLRHPQLDLLIAEYPEDILEAEGMLYQGSNIVVLDNPSETEMILLRDTIDGSMAVIKKENNVSIRHKRLTEDYILEREEDFLNIYLQKISSIL